jgi:hypothetical protein
MDSGWAAILGAVVGGTASIAATGFAEYLRVRRTNKLDTIRKSVLKRLLAGEKYKWRRNSDGHVELQVIARFGITAVADHAPCVGAYRAALQNKHADPPISQTSEVDRINAIDHGIAPRVWHLLQVVFSRGCLEHHRGGLLPLRTHVGSRLGRSHQRKCALGKTKKATDILPLSSLARFGSASHYF